jgi:hypothetical protein
LDGHGYDLRDGDCDFFVDGLREGLDHLDSIRLDDVDRISGFDDGNGGHYMRFGDVMDDLFAVWRRESRECIADLLSDVFEGTWVLNSSRCAVFQLLHDRLGLLKSL